jgi:electron-transferring-flavoprotein dehydrogenase
VAGEQAEALGVEIFPGFAAAEVLYDEQGRVRAWPPATWASARTASRTTASSSAWSCCGKYTVFAEGARGHLGKQLLARYKLDEGRDPQTYAIGIKELWECPPTRPSPAWWCTPPAGRWTTTPSAAASSTTWKATRSRWASSSGWTTRTRGPEPVRGDAALEDAPGDPRAHRRRQAHRLRRARHQQRHAAGLPKTGVPGRRAGRLRRRLPERRAHQGQPCGHQERHAGAEAIAPALAAGRAQDELTAYPEAFEKSWLHEELQQTRNFKLWFKKGKTVGQLMTGIEQWLLPKLGVKSPPWTLHNHKPDHEALQPGRRVPAHRYPKPDGRLTFDRLSSVFVSNTNHEENQPAHLTLKDAACR